MPQNACFSRLSPCTAVCTLSLPAPSALAPQSHPPTLGSLAPLDLFFVRRHLACAGACTMPLQGQLGGGLNLLPQLQVLDLSGNNFSGALPEYWGEPGSFPELSQL